MQTKSKLLTNGWTDESSPLTPSVGLMPPSSSSSTHVDRCTSRHQGSSASGGTGGGGGGGGGGVEPRTSQLGDSSTIAGRLKSRLPEWLTDWWQDGDKAIMVEVISRAVFPLLFFIFNAVYWPWYLM